MSENHVKGTAILVHGAFADGSLWNKVIPLLWKRGLDAVSVQLPLTSLSDDAATVRKAIKRIKGPVVLAGHSYGGAPVTAASAGEASVKALAFIAAIAPDKGETVGELFTRVAPHPKAQPLVPDEDGLIWMSAQGFRDAAAHEATPGETALMAATQRPISVKCLTEPLAAPGWAEKPSWFLLAARDRQISPETQRFMAERMKAHIDRQEVDHIPLVSAPEVVANFILRAAV
jgi:pimeloyl-ACP methyl ester carboxylesterase